MSSTPAMGDVIIDVHDLWSIFPTPDGGEIVVHKNLNLQVRRGEILTIVGGSGTGKTVLLRRILGLDAPTRGTVTVLGRPAIEQNDRDAATRVGMLFQQGALFSAFNVLDNIAQPLRERKAVPAAVARDAALLKLKMAGLHAKDAPKMPADLSGGMIKRVALARALIMDPPLLVLDEPTAGLDPESSDEFCLLLRDLHRELGLTVVMVTHDLDTLFALSTRVAVLADQQVIVTGTVDEVAAFPHPFIQEYFHGARGESAMRLHKAKLAQQAQENT